MTEKNKALALAFDAHAHLSHMKKQPHLVSNKRMT
jgi:hypothetical protein